MSAPDRLLDVRRLRTHFHLRRPYPFGPRPTVHAVDDISFAIPRGSTFGLVGESGCGKSTTALSVLRLVEPSGGEMRFDGEDMLGMDRETMRRLRRRLQIVFQDPYSSLNPRRRAGETVLEPLQIQGIGSAGERDARVDEMFGLVGLRPEQKALFPHQFSGGQRQRIAIARALATSPELVVCDEIVSALDVAIQAKILNLLKRLQRELHLTYLFISHDLAVMQYMCDEIGVMYLGQIVEQADRRALFQRPLHPYTQALLAAVPRIESATDRSRRTSVKITGDPPSPIDPPPGCRFAARCPYAIEHCRTDTPILRDFGAHHVACHRVSDDGIPPSQRFEPRSQESAVADVPA